MIIYVNYFLKLENQMHNQLPIQFSKFQQQFSFHLY